MSGYYAQNPHYLGADNSDEAERQERIEREASGWFWDLVGPQKLRHTERLNFIAIYRGTPRYDRDFDAAQRAWQTETAEANAVYQMALADLEATGEISEATNDAYARVKAGEPAAPLPVAQAAE